MRTDWTVRRVVTAIVGGLLLAGSAPAEAIDTRDWGKKYTSTSQRFVVLSEFNNEAVLDKETQLVWQRTNLLGGYRYHQARDACFNATIGGRRGWRLPTVAELTSLIDPTSSAVPKFPAGHPFNVFGTGLYWTSTFDRLSEQVAGSPASWGFFMVNLSTGAIQSQFSLYDDRFLCVRGADPGTSY